jgi:hypothetical protein
MNYENKTDKELINLVINNHDTDEGKEAREILEYRKYLATKRYNAWLLVLTIVLAGSTILQVVVSLVASSAEKHRLSIYMP